MSDLQSPLVTSAIDKMGSEKPQPPPKKPGLSAQSTFALDSSGTWPSTPIRVGHSDVTSSPAPVVSPSLHRRVCSNDQTPELTQNSNVDGDDSGLQDSMNGSIQTALEELSQPADNHDSGNSNPPQKFYDIVYKATCLDQRDKFRVKIDRYDSKPFEGIDREDDPSRQELAVMDVMILSIGQFPDDRPRRLNQSRKHFGTDSLEDNDRPFVFGKDFISRSRDTPTIRIFSKHVLEVLRQEVKYYPSVTIPPREFLIRHPYEVLVLHYDQLREIANNNQTALPKTEDLATMPSTQVNADEEITGKHLRVVLDWLYDSYYKEEIEPELALHRKGRATFSKLWLLYKPGTTVSATVNGQSAFYKVLSARNDPAKLGDDEQMEPWHISVWYLDFNGERLTRRARELVIREYEGDREIRTLDIVPVGYMETDNDMETLTKRGRAFYDIIRQAPAYKLYSGMVGGGQKARYSGGVVVDPLKSFERFRAERTDITKTLGTIGFHADSDDLNSEFKEPNDMGGGPLYAKFNNVAYSAETELEDKEMYLLMPGQIRGFALGKKQWTTFDIQFMQDPKPLSYPLDNLVIGDSELDLIRSLAKSGSRDSKPFWEADFVNGKGLGQIVLLHGPPGVGKTFTVECLAEQLQRPLMTLTVADLSSSGTILEQRLSAWLDLAERWNAIVLIDEVDIFLAKRKQSELDRNALVTAFLRAMEYYPGMMFLTTNQPGYIDDAFNSRFHLIIEYPHLDKEKRVKIWEKFIDRVNEDQEDHPKGNLKVDLRDDILKYVKEDEKVKALELNGRDIRNIFRAAINIAIFESGKKHMDEQAEKVEKVRIQKEHFEKVIKNKTAYSKYLQKGLGRDEHMRAHDSSARFRDPSDKEYSDCE